MKKRLLCFTLAVAGVLAIGMTACNGGGTEPEPEPEEETEDPYLTVGSESLTFEAGGGLQTLTVEGNIAWDFSQEGDWITATKLSETQLEVSIGGTAEARDGSLTITSELDDIIIAIHQNELETEYPEAYEFVGATGFFMDQWIDGAGTFLVYLTGYERDAQNQPLAEGYQMFLRIISYQAVLGQPLIDIPEGTYPFSQRMDWDTVFLGADSNTDLLTGIEWKTPDGTSEQKLLKGGALTVTGTGRDYRLELEMEFQDGTFMEAVYEGPMLVQNHYDNMLSTLTGNRTGLTADHGIVANTGVLYSPGTYTWIATLMSNGLSKNEHGFFEGSGHYVELELNAGDGLESPAGEYDFAWVPSNPYGAGTASMGELLFDINAPNNGRIGSWYYEIEEGKIVDFAPFISGHVTFGELGTDDSATATIDGVDDVGNTIELDFDGRLEVIDYVPL